MVSALFVADDPPAANGLSPIDEEDEPPEENWEFEEPVGGNSETGYRRETV